MRELFQELMKTVTEKPSSMGLSENSLFLKVTNKGDRPLLVAKLHELRKSGRFSGITVNVYSDILSIKNGV